MPIWSKCWTIWGFYGPQNKSLDQSILLVQICDWAVTADELSGSLRFFRPWFLFYELDKVFFFQNPTSNFGAKIEKNCGMHCRKGRICGRKLRKKLRGHEHQAAQSVERRALEVEVRGSKLVMGTWCGVGFHLTSPNRRALRRRRPHYSQSGDPRFPGKVLI